MGLVWALSLHGAVAAVAYSAARDVFRQPAGWPRVLAAAVIGWTWLTVGMELLGSFGLLARWPMAAWVAAGGSLAFGIRTAFPSGGPPHEADSSKAEGGPWGWEGVTALGLVLTAALSIGVTSMLLPVKVVSDGPIYHLYFAARWWKAGSLDLIAAPFGENAATYFPGVGDLWFSWLMVVWGGDRLAKVGQAPFLLLAGQAAYALARRLGAGRSAAVVAAAWFVGSSPLFRFSFEANVDTVFTAGYLLAAYFTARHALGDDGPASLWLASLAAGCALGTKAVGVVFVPPLLALGAWSAWRKEGWRFPGLLAVAVGPLVASGFWFVRNAWLTGNPLYPLQVSAFGRVWLAGWYGPEVMKLSRYYLPRDDWRSLADTLLAVLDPRLAPVWALALAGAWAWGRPRTGPAGLTVWAAAGLAALNVALYWLVIPYRTQQRFMLHALGLAVPPLALTFDRARAVRSLGVALLAAHVLSPQSWPFSDPDVDPPWDFTRSVPNFVHGLIVWPGADVLRLARLALAAFGGFGAAWAWGRFSARPGTRNGTRAAAVSGLAFAATVLGFYPWGVKAPFLTFPAFPEYVRGWLELDQRSGPVGARVAYAGNALPYYLFGVGLRNDVRYVNVDAHRDWLLHDYHRGADPPTWPHPRPGWDRLHPDYDAWLANLRAHRIQLLVVNRVNPAEGAHNVADPEGFPVERSWAESHPEAFTPLYGVAERDPQFRLYRVRPAGRD